MPTTLTLIPILSSPRTLQTCDRCGQRQEYRPRSPIPGPSPMMYLNPVDCEVVCSHCVWGNPENN